MNQGQMHPLNMVSMFQAYKHAMDQSHITLSESEQHSMAARATLPFQCRADAHSMLAAGGMAKDASCEHLKLFPADGSVEAAALCKSIGARCQCSESAALSHAHPVPQF